MVWCAGVVVVPTRPARRRSAALSLQDRWAQFPVEAREDEVVVVEVEVEVGG